MNRIKKLIDDIYKLPGIGKKNAENLAFFLLQNRDISEEIKDSLEDSLKNIKQCKVCHHLTSKDVCEICSDKTRENVICIVQDSRDIYKIEKIGFSGKYHVLNGKLDPIQKIDEKDLNILSLERRLSSEKPSKLLLSLDSDREGELTSMYIFNRFKDKVSIERIATGLPMGSSIQNIDIDSLKEAFNNRRKV